jgi:hypothetical protein
LGRMVVVRVARVEVLTVGGLVGLVLDGNVVTLDLLVWPL